MKKIDIQILNKNAFILIIKAKKFKIENNLASIYITGESDLLYCKTPVELVIEANKIKYKSTLGMKGILFDVDCFSERELKAIYKQLKNIIDMEYVSVFLRGPLRCICVLISENLKLEKKYHLKDSGENLKRERAVKKKSDMFEKMGVLPSTNWL